MPRTKNNRRTAKATLTALSALDLRGQGLSFEEIGRKLGVHKSTAFRRVVAEMAKAAYESTEYAKDLLGKELATLDLLLDKAIDAVEDGNIDAITKAIKVMERRARYLGLDKPTEVKAEVATTSGGFMSKEQMLAEVLDKLKTAKKGSKS